MRVDGKTLSPRNGRYVVLDDNKAIDATHAEAMDETMTGPLKSIHPRRATTTKTMNTITIDIAAIRFMVESFNRCISAGFSYILVIVLGYDEKKNFPYSIMLAPEFIVYAKSSGCQFCDAAKALLDKHRRVYSTRVFETLDDLRQAVAPHIPASRV